jgi:alpha-ketoglutarate-dependent taurine dioxygenase
LTTASLGTKLGLRKITARIGAEVTGVSPSLELDPDTVTAVRAALSEHKALVFRGIDVDDDGQQRFAPPGDIAALISIQALDTWLANGDPYGLSTQAGAQWALGAEVHYVRHHQGRFIFEKCE